MFGGYTGYTLSEATLSENEIQSSSATYKIFGALQLKDDFYLKLDGKKLYLKLSSENRISGAQSVRNIECLYQR